MAETIVRTVGPEGERAIPPATYLDKPGYRADVQGLRAIAVVLVVLYHAGFGFGGGFVGVDAFFVLSGFVIARRLRWEVATTGSVDIRDFMRRRVVRILPAAAITTIAAVLGTIFFAPMSGRSASISTSISGALFNANNMLANQSVQTGGYFEQSTGLNPFMHMWSLSVEEQFYLVFPLLVLGAAVFARRSSTSQDLAIKRVLLTVMLVSFAASLIAVERNHSLAFYLAPFRAWEFLVGAAIVWVERVRWSRPTALAFSIAGGVMLLWAAWVFEEGGGFPGLYALVPVAATALLIVGGSGEQSWAQTVFGHRSLGFVGRVSYAWYLWHWPLIVFAKASFNGTVLSMLVAVGASFVIAVASTLYFEEPIRSRKWTGKGAARVAFACVGLSLLASLGSLSLLRVNEQSVSMDTFEESFRQAGPAGELCLSVADPTDECTYVADAPAGDVLLIGDSTAWQLFPGMVKAAEATNHNLTMASLRGCPTAGVEIRLFGFLRDEACPVFWKTAMDDLEAASPDVVVIALATDWYINYGSNELIAPDGAFISDPAERVELLRPALLETMTDLSDRVDEIIFVGITPKFADWQPRDCSYWSWKYSPDSCGMSRSWDEINAERAAALQLEAELVQATGARFIDLDSLLCDEQGCSTNRGDYWIFRDYGHISTNESERLAPVLAAAIEQS